MRDNSSRSEQQAGRSSLIEVSGSDGIRRKYHNCPQCDWNGAPLVFREKHSLRGEGDVQSDADRKKAAREARRENQNHLHSDVTSNPESMSKSHTKPIQRAMRSQQKKKEHDCRHARLPFRDRQGQPGK